MTAYRRIGALVIDGILEVVTLGNERKATRYRYLRGD